MIDLHPAARISPLADIEDSVRGTRIVVGAQVRFAHDRDMAAGQILTLFGGVLVHHVGQ